MRPRVYGPVAQVSILTVLLLCSEAYSEHTDCIPTIKVRRDTIYETELGRDFRIQCPVETCNNSAPNITWTKDSVTIMINDTRIDTEWQYMGSYKGIAYLIFHKVLISDYGSYQCKAGDDVSHVITVNVSDVLQPTTVAWPDIISSTHSHQPDPIDTLWLYVYCAGGTMLLVLLVIAVTVLAIMCCKGKSRKQNQSESPYTFIPMPQLPALPPNPLRPGDPDHIYDNAPYRAKSSANRVTSLRDEGGGGEPACRREMTEADVRSHGEITYASLNHQALPPGRAARPLRPKEEPSEYAAIRVC